LQAPLYMLAAERVFGAAPAGMFYVGLKGGVVYAGWSDSAPVPAIGLPEGWLDRAVARTLQAVAEIRAGGTDRAPADADHCRLCDFRDVCRVSARRARELAEGA
jgi:hypothetical protein